MSASYSEIGELLRNAREEMRLELFEVEQMLHIRMRYIQALEQGNLEKLPGLAYAKGYLQSYAAFLNLDKDEILRRFEQADIALARPLLNLPQVFNKEKSPNEVVVKAGLGVAALVALVWMIVVKSQYISISPVEPMPDTLRYTLQFSDDVACLQKQGVLYPPCHYLKKEWTRYSVLPPQGRVKTVMELR